MEFLLILIIEEAELVQIVANPLTNRDSQIIYTTKFVPKMLYNQLQFSNSQFEEISFCRKSKFSSIKNFKEKKNVSPITDFSSGPPSKTFLK